MRYLLSEEDFKHRVESLVKLHSSGKGSDREVGITFFDAAMGQETAVLENAFSSLPTDCYPVLWGYVIDYEENNYDCRVTINFCLARTEEVEKSLAESRPVIEKTCRELRRLLEESGEEVVVEKPDARPDKPTEIPEHLPLNDLRHVDCFKERGDSAMAEAVTHVCSRDYPVELFGYQYSMNFRITTSKTDFLYDGDWTIGFGFSQTENSFYFSLWEWTPKGVVKLPSRECDPHDFNDAVDELIAQMSSKEGPWFN